MCQFTPRGVNWHMYKTVRCRITVGHHIRLDSSTRLWTPPPHTHTHTHAYIHIYIYIYICFSLPLVTPEFKSLPYSGFQIIQVP